MNNNTIFEATIERLNAKECSSIERLIFALSHLNNMCTVTVCVDEDSDENNAYFDECILLDYVTDLACSELIESNGSCNWTNIRKVRDAGYQVYAGDSDSFGWLTGCIETSRGIVVYG